MTRSTCSPHLSCKDKISSGGQIFHRTMITLTDSRRWACCDAWKQYILTTTNWQQTNISLSSTSTFPWSAGRIMTSPFLGAFVIFRWDINFHHNSWKWGAELVEFLSTVLAPYPHTRVTNSVRLTLIMGISYWYVRQQTYAHLHYTPNNCTDQA